MSKRELILKEIGALYIGGLKLAESFQNKSKGEDFQFEYQTWYSKALKVLALLAPDRLDEFRGYYLSDPKRKTLNYGSFAIQDFMKGIVPNKFSHPDFDSRRQALQCFVNQLAILNAIDARAGSILGNIEAELYAELQDTEVVVARQLARVNLRAAGALVGVLIEGHLQKVASAHGVTVAKKNPTIADLNDPLKAASVIDTPTWRKISYLADLRNLCSHKKDADPTMEQVKELIDGAEWLTKNVS
jgi:hypothetical protein